MFENANEDLMSILRLLDGGEYLRAWDQLKTMRLPHILGVVGYMPTGHVDGLESCLMALLQNTDQVSDQQLITQTLEQIRSLRAKSALHPGH